MSEINTGLRHRRIEQNLSQLLKTGVMIAALVVFMGGALYLARHGATLPDYKVFHGQPANLRSISGIVTDALSMHSRGAILFGVLLLIATPVARVLFTFFAFARERDVIYAVMTLIVLTLLVYNFFT
jgi:uncharacterized membrane protein